MFRQEVPNFCDGKLPICAKLAWPPGLLGLPGPLYCLFVPLCCLSWPPGMLQVPPRAPQALPQSAPDLQFCSPLQHFRHFFKNCPLCPPSALGLLPGSSWSPLGRLLGPAWALLGASWPQLGASWAPYWLNLDLMECT